MAHDPIALKYAGLKDPGLRAFMIAGEKFYPAGAVNFTMAEQRAFYDKYCAHFSSPYPPGIATRDFKIGHIPCREYLPENEATSSALLYLHGGGYVLGGIASHDSICADLCGGAGIRTIAVAYRLAPEHPFPGALDDCWEVFMQAVNEGKSIVVCGDSAGGNLAAAIAIKARDAGISAIRGQVLIYPGLGGDMTKGSYQSQANAPGLTLSDVQYYRDVYKGGENKLASPLLETDYAALPPAFLVAAGLDPLHDDCISYGQNLRNAGVSAEIREEPLLVHAFLRARTMSAPAAESFTAIIAAIRQMAESPHK